MAQNGDESHLSRLGINVDRLESEMNAAVSKDARYWLENDTKIRAVEQGVPTYEHFRQLVAGCHLQPLEKSELVELAKSKPGWNPARSSYTSSVATKYANRLDSEALLDSQTPQKFYSLWQKIQSTKSLSSQEKYDRLAELCLHQRPNLFRDLFDCGLGVSILSELLVVLEYTLQRDESSSTVSINGNKNDDLFSFAIHLLSSLCESTQFPLALDLLSDSEREQCSKFIKILLSRQCTSASLSSDLDKIKRRFEIQSI
ncbi:unnamed protein product [Calicophoron daubneyi]|uniref:Coiled-coil domain-containing protein 103 n=1 Tax=Calicophoron daubneyi TaxID=300641 RepID=A0AAV2U2B7_CALDB